MKPLRKWRKHTHTQFLSALKDDAHSNLGRSFTRESIERDNLWRLRYVHEMKKI